MAGPWFVDPENGSLTNNGLSADTPWLLIPGQTGANAQTGYGVVDGDTINVRNGTTSTLRIALTAPNLTYRGYGLADNVLTLTLPASDVTKTRTVRVVREAGVHEGMWTIDATNNDADGGALSISLRAGCVFEDLNIIGPQVNARKAVAFASSTQATNGVTMRRFCITGSAAAGITAYATNVTLEWGRIAFTADDSINLAASAANSYRAGSVDTLRYLELREPNRAYEGAAETGTAGDWLHLTPLAGTWDGTLIAHDILGYKTTDAKQGMVLHQTAAGGSIDVQRLHIGGGGDCQILVGHIKNSMSFRDIYAEDWSYESFPLFRFDAMDVSPPAWAMDTGSTLTIKNVISDSVGPAIYSAIYSDAAFSFDGTIDISSVTAVGANADSESYAAAFGFWSATSQSTFGVNFQLYIRNCSVQIDNNRHVTLPTGVADSAQWVVANNCFSASTYAIGATSYSTVALFEAAHSAATGNTEGDPLLSPSYRPLPGSPLIGAGTHLGYTRDLNGVQRPNPPSIGAYDVATLRTPA